MTFSESISTWFAKFSNFNGRASRAEFWWFFLSVTGCEFIADVWDYVTGESEYGFFIWLVLLATLVPSISVGARRLHDVGKSGWYQLLALTIIGLIPLFFWYASVGENKENKFD